MAYRAQPVSLDAVDDERKQYVMRGGQRFEKRPMKPPGPAPRPYVPNYNDNTNCCVDLCCSLRIGGTGNYSAMLLMSENAPDRDFCADSRVQLSQGITAYRFIEPASASDDTADEIPVIVCLHGLTSSSYMWGDIADLLADSEQGPNARILVYDMYGHGRSPWTGHQMTMDVLVTQLKELLDFLCLTSNPVSLIGHDIGAAVATGFCAKFPTLAATLTLIAPCGIKFKMPNDIALLRRDFIGEIALFARRKKLALLEKGHFLNTSDAAPHRNLIEKQMAMTQWQVDYTPGYVGALLSAYRVFPLVGMEELYVAVGRHSRPVLIVWGSHDKICTARSGVKKMEESFPKGTIVDIQECGHNPLYEKFNETAAELLSFHKECFIQLYVAD